VVTGKAVVPIAPIICDIPASNGAKRQARVTAELGSTDLSWPESESSSTVSADQGGKGWEEGDHLNMFFKALFPVRAVCPCGELDRRETKIADDQRFARTKSMAEHRPTTHSALGKNISLPPSPSLPLLHLNNHQVFARVIKANQGSKNLIVDI